MGERRRQGVGRSRVVCAQTPTAGFRSNVQDDAMVTPSAILNRPCQVPIAPTRVTKN